ncbi:MAG: hypothetical protein JO225_14590 [Candidatus Eremiobacteraeota bacterium]|nr:hypothetical protein [Candidatus Eremiobacteraeota bacterium]MBV8645133.1 hypothetical protein [Candidatus Eremiobacteraeota bacterium]
MCTLLCAVAIGCSGTTSISPQGAATSGNSTSGPASSARRPASPRFGRNSNVRPQRNRPRPVAIVGQSHGRRSPSAVVTTANEEQVVGFTYGPNDANNQPIEAVQFYGTANATLSLPNPAAGQNYLVSPDTTIGSNSCIELKTVYFRNAGDADTTRELHAFDTCQNVEYSLATIDATFQSTYETDLGNGDGNQYFVAVQNVGTNWQVLLFNNTTSAYDTLFTGSTLASTPTQGSSVFNIDSFVVGACPTLPIQAVTGFDTSADLSTYIPVGATAYGPTIVPAPTPATTPDCFLTTPNTSPHYQVVYDSPIDQWEVKTIAAVHTPPPHPTPTPSPTPTPTPTLPPSVVTSYTFTGQPYRYAELGDGRVIVETTTSANNDATISLLDPSSGTISQLEVVSNSFGDAIASGTDGDVWIGFRLNQSGTAPNVNIRRYSASGSNINVSLSDYRQAIYVESASDQRLFVTGGDGSGNCVFDTVDTSGNIVNYANNTVCGPLLRGSDNGMWTGASTGTSTGTATRYSISDLSATTFSIPAAGTNATTILSGLSGTLLGLVNFNRINTIAIASYDTSGHAGARNNVPIQTGGPQGFGPDGSYWMANSSVICRQNPGTGASKCYTLGSVTQPGTGFVSGSHSRLWYTNGNNLYKLDVSGMDAAP